MTGVAELSSSTRAIGLAAVAAAFCAVSYSASHYWDEYFYVYSVWQHPVADLIRMETGLSDGLFPNGFFSAKLGFVVLVDGLVQATGAGAGGLLALRLVFCGMALAFGIFTWLLVRELADGTAAWKTALVALFLPVPVYLGFKVLSEMPALLLATVGGWLCVRSLRAAHASPVSLLGAAACIAGAALMRITSILFLVGLLAALLAQRPSSIPPQRLWRRLGIIVSIAAVIGTAALVSFVDAPFDRLTGLAHSVTSRRPDMLVTIYAVVLTLQFFAIPAIAGLRRPLQGSAAALLWLAAGMVPYLVASRYVEPRYFYTATIPIALLAATGLDRLASALWPRRVELAWLLLFAATVTLNRSICAPLMPYEIHEGRYMALMQQLRSSWPSATYVTPWVSDFCFLAFTRPSDRVGLAWSDSYGSGRIFTQPEFGQWLARHPYVGSLDELSAQARPWFYVGWDYSPTVRAIDSRVRLVGYRYLDDPDRRSRLLNHLSPSWIWSSDALRLDPVVSIGEYHAFAIVPRDGG